MKYDIILVTAEPFVDHPFSGVAILKKILEKEKYAVGIIENPDWKEEDDFRRLGEPNLFFGVTSGAIDSMLVNYTPLKKKRQENEFSKMSYVMPDRAVTVYCNAIKRIFKGSSAKIVIGGTESSLRRFTHFDYWDNSVRKSILFDTRADMLVYGPGELQILEIARRLKDKRNLAGINGTCIISGNIPKNAAEKFIELPAFDEVKSADKQGKEKFCEMQNLISPKKNIAQKTGDRYILQYKMPKYGPEDLDSFYSFDYSRRIPGNYPEMKNFRWSVVTHRGCFGNCNFCSIAVNSGNGIISRSEENILEEIKRIAKDPEFDGTVELSGASANMYGMDCKHYDTCVKNDCLNCNLLDSSHSRMISLLQKSRAIRGIRRIIVKSGMRYDLAMRSPEYIREIVKYHNDGKLMVAPEHTDNTVLKAMNKDYDIDEFVKKFYSLCKTEKVNCDLTYYSMVAHPGSTVESSKKLAEFIKKHRFSDYVQVFTPTPMTVSTCMYHTGLDPKNGKEIYVPYTYNEKKIQKNIALDRETNSKNRHENDDIAKEKRKKIKTNK